MGNVWDDYGISVGYVCIYITCMRYLWYICGKIVHVLDLYGISVRYIHVHGIFLVYVWDISAFIHGIPLGSIHASESESWYGSLRDPPCVWNGLAHQNVGMVGGRTHVCKHNPIQNIQKAIRSRGVSKAPPLPLYVWCQLNGLLRLKPQR